MSAKSLGHVDPYYRGLRHEMLPFVPDSIASALDVGCGAGGFGEMIKERTGAEVWGIEINQNMGEEAKSRLDKVIMADAIEAMRSIPNKRFDAIIFNDVLEHMAWPDEALCIAATLLSETGVVVASIPNIRYFRALKQIVLRRDFPWEDSGVFDRTHLRFFTEKSIVRLFESSGYQVERIEGINAAVGTKLSIALFLTFGLFRDARYLQYAVVASPMQQP
jgi:2-polyprenyl-3-methyl-5-hydroxy-6-metoxy-1,4-benzoquinol methylase